MPVKDDLQTLETKVADLVNWITESSLEDNPANFINAWDCSHAPYNFYDFFNAIHTDILEAMESKEIEGGNDAKNKAST